MRTTVCIAEDREACEPSLRLLLASLAKNSPEVTVSLFYPRANERFADWIKKWTWMHLQTHGLPSGHGWNIKPQAIIQMLQQGYDEVIWIDSDVIVERDIRSLFARLDTSIFAATEDALGEDHSDLDSLRARLWGFPVGRALPFGLNSGVLRVTKDHLLLMRRWWELLRTTTYQESQRKEWRQRPVHMLGDQDVLTALLTSRDFSEIPLFLLRRGQHIVQFNGVYGYTIAERLKNLVGHGPVFIHSFAGKPWSANWTVNPKTDLREYVKKIYLDLSPYTLSAMRFKDVLECDTAWMEPHYLPSRILRALGMGSPPLVGLPVAVIMDLARLLKRE